MMKLKYIYAILCAALVLAGCSNIIDPPESPKESGLRINVSSDGAPNGAVNERTLFPKINFTKYVLSFSGPASHADITLSGGDTTATVNDLANGEWTVIVKGFILINGTEHDAAQGSAPVNVAEGTYQSVDVILRAIMDGDNGVFSYSVSFPPSRVNSAELRIYSYVFDENDGEYRDLTVNPSDTISLEPGYYMMTIRLDNDYQTLGHTELVYICSNMETEANYTFTESDFTKFITLSGTIDVKVKGQAPQEVYLVVFLDENNNSYVNHTMVDLSDNTWSMTLAAFDIETPLYFFVAASYNDGYFYKEIGEGVKAHDIDKPGINLGEVNFTY